MADSNFFHVAIVLCRTCLLLGFVGCAAPLTYGHPAETIGKGKFQISAAGGISASTGIADLVDVGINQSKTLLNQQRSCAQADRKDCIRVSDLGTATRAMYGAGVAGLLEPVAELAVAYGIMENFDVGGRVRGGMQRLDVNYQLMDGGPTHTGWTSLVSLSYSHQKGALPIPQLQSLLELLGMGDNTRHNFDLALAMGTRLGDYGWFLAAAICWGAITLICGLNCRFRSSTTQWAMSLSKRCRAPMKAVGRTKQACSSMCWRATNSSTLAQS